MKRRTFVASLVALAVAPLAWKPSVSVAERLSRIAARMRMRRPEVFWNGYYWSVDAQRPNRLWFRLPTERSASELSFIDLPDARITGLFPVHDLGDNRPGLHIEAVPESRTLHGATPGTWYVTPYGRPFELITTA